MLFLVSWIYLGLTFFEPRYAGDTGFFDTVESSRLSTLRAIESVIISLFWIDNLLSIIHRLNDTSTPIWKKYFANIKHGTKLAVHILFLVDFIYFNIAITAVPLRFSRFFRTCIFLFLLLERLTNITKVNLFLYSRQLRRTIQAILGSYKQIFVTLLFFFLISVIFALIGRRVLGTLETEYNEVRIQFIMLRLNEFVHAN